ncbi:CinA family protein [Puniceibacterium sp. IMCC21224]|uniref:CinA family protein n=1 Tax=Puniceibacterium sp. IMCC21224 TaxID=1618204 RepID=UPI00064D8428|nr:nicotinamide-nucleotide amidohydrolase family protein [Puniceibacterium sp. IMCC21224]KMK66955.1 competence/damage-inducible protein CinA-like protein [Puniceibacterium sp. IMCC21224]
MTEALATEILQLSLARGLTVTCAESCTGGLVAAAITDIAGSSAIFERGFVTYSNLAKQEMIGVSAATLDSVGAVSEEVCAEMALGALHAAGSDIAVSVSGIAGPGGSEFKPEGRVCFGLATDAGVTTETIEFGALGRTHVRAAATRHALTLLKGAIEAIPTP